MDSLTQVVLGAAVGEAVLGRKAGNRAALWGAVAGTIPDLDVLGNLFMSEFESLIAHRAFTHSLVFCVLAAPILGYLLFRFYKGKYGSQKEWTLLAFWAFLTHTLLDCFTTWGTQLFFPFHDLRVAFNAVFVIDPLYTLPFLVFLILALTRSRNSRWRRIWNILGLSISSFYLVLCVTNKLSVEAVFSNALHRAGKSVTRMATFPTPFNNVLWYVVAEEPSGYDMGYFSMLGDYDQPISFTFFPKNHRLLKGREEEFLVDRMKWVSNGYYTLDKQADVIVWNDLRFGIVERASAPGEPEFIFSYHLIEQDSTFIDIEQAPTFSGQDGDGNGGNPFDTFFKEIWPGLWEKLWGG